MPKLFVFIYNNINLLHLCIIIFCEWDVQCYQMTCQPLLISLFCFCFRDVSFGRENFPITSVNIVDDEGPPLDFQYVTQSVETTPLSINRVISSLQVWHFFFFFWFASIFVTKMFISQVLEVIEEKQKLVHIWNLCSRHLHQWLSFKIFIFLVV